MTITLMCESFNYLRGLCILLETVLPLTFSCMSYQIIVILKLCDEAYYRFCQQYIKNTTKADTGGESSKNETRHYRLFLASQIVYITRTVKVPRHVVLGSQSHAGALNKLQTTDV